jgi:hypothetical protein
MGHDVVVADRCGICGEEGDNVLTLDVESESAHARVELRAFPYRTCRYGHEKVYVYPDFGSDLNEFIFSAGASRSRSRRGDSFEDRSCAAPAAPRFHRMKKSAITSSPPSRRSAVPRLLG